MAKEAKKDAKLSKEEEAKLADKKARRAESKKVLKAAKATLHDYMATADFKKLPKEVQDAINRLAAKRKSGGVRKNWMDLFTGLFPKIGASIHELDLFKQTKMGRGEFRKKVRHALKKAEPEQRMWITFNEKAETWTLLGTGKDTPDGFK
jgi:hypothetical protein